MRSLDGRKPLWSTQREKKTRIYLPFEGTKQDHLFGGWKNAVQINALSLTERKRKGN